MFAKLVTSTVLVMAIAPAAFAETLNWTASLDQAQQTAISMEAPGAIGVAQGTLDTDTGAMNWSVSYEGLSGEITGMHLHGPAAMGEVADVLVDVTPADAMAMPAEGEAVLTPEQMALIGDGMVYLNIHTDANPDGEIRGQVAIAQ